MSNKQPTESEIKKISLIKPVTVNKLSKLSKAYGDKSLLEIRKELGTKSTKK